MKENKYIDLSLLLTKNTPVFPGEPDIIFKQHANIKENTYNEHQITINTHFGTHMDFPYHMINDGKKSNDYKLEKFIGKGKVIDIYNPDLNSIEDEEKDICLNTTIKRDIIPEKSSESKSSNGENYRYGKKDIGEILDVKDLKFQDRKSVV